MSRKRILRHSAARWHQARSRLLLKVVILVAACSTEHDSREPMGTETSALAAPTFPSDLSFPASSIVPVNTRSSSDPTTIGATSSSSEVSSDGEASVAIPLWVSPGRRTSSHPWVCSTGVGQGTESWGMAGRSTEWPKSRGADPPTLEMGRRATSTSQCVGTGRRRRNTFASTVRDSSSPRVHTGVRRGSTESSRTGS